MIGACLRSIAMLFLISFLCFVLAKVWGETGWRVIGLLLLGFMGLKISNLAAAQSQSRFASFFHWIHAIIFELLGIVVVFVCRPIGFLWKLKGKGDGTPILLVHGYLHDSSAWIYLRWALKKKGLGPIYLINLASPLLPIEEFAKQVGRRAMEIEAETGQKQLILIGHSMGGLVGSLYATRFAPEGKVKKVITIGSPLEGTVAAKIGIGPPAREMERNSKFIQDLQKAVKSEQTIRFYHIASKTDQLVIPYRSALIDGDVQKQFLLKDIGHVTMLYSPRVKRKILSFLED